MTGNDGHSVRPAGPFGTVGTAMVTPFTRDGAAVDFDAAQRVAAHLVSRGSDMLVLSGTTGEAPTLADAEKVALVRAVREAVGDDITVLSGVGSNETYFNIQLARAHAELPVDGLMVVTPYYSKPSQEGIIAHTTAIADATDLPVLLYDIPGRSSVPLATDTLLALSEHERIVAVKDAKGDMLQAALVMAQTDLAYYSGEDAVNLPWLAMGASGVISVVGHAAPELEARLVRTMACGDLAGARAANAALAPLVQAVMTRMPGAVAAKCALMLQGVLPHAAVRLPLVTATPAQLELLAAALAAADGIPPLLDRPQEIL